MLLSKEKCESVVVQKRAGQSNDKHTQTHTHTHTHTLASNGLPLPIASGEWFLYLVNTS